MLFKYLLNTKKYLKTNFAFSILSFFLIVSFLIISPFFFRGEIIGHRLDWSVPIRADFIKEYIPNVIYKWRLQELGFEKIFYTNFFLAELFVGFLGLIGVSGYWVTRFLIWSPIFISGVSMSFLLRYILQFYLKKPLNYFKIVVPALFYCTSYAMFNQLIGGNWGIAVSAAFFPFTLMFSLKYFNYGKLKYAILASIFYSLSIFQIHYLIFFPITLFIYWLYVGNKTLILKRIFLIFFLFAILNLFWIIDFIPIISASSNIIYNKATNTDLFGQLKNGYNSLIHGFLLDGWGYSNLSIKEPMSFILSSFLLFILTCSILLIKKYRSLTLLLWVNILIYFFLFTGLRPPFQSLKSIFFSLPGSNLFRSPQHVLFMVAFFQSLLLLLLMNSFNKRKYMQYFVAALVLLANYTFFPTFFYKNFEYYSQSPLITQALKITSGDSGIYRVMFLPSAMAPYIPENNFIPKVGADADTYYFPVPTFSTEGTDESDIRQKIEIKIYENNFNALDLNQLNIKYIFLRNDRAHGNIDYGVKYWNQNNLDETYSKLYNILVTKEFLDLKLSGKQGATLYSIWENKNYSSGEILPKDIQFQRVNPTQYSIKINNLVDKKEISLLENYNSGWKIFIRKIKESTFYGNNIVLSKDLGTNNQKWVFFQGDEFGFLFNKPVFDDSHKQIFGYANDWEISSEYIMKNFSKEYYKKNPDGSIDIEMTLYFKPQSYFYIGLIISGTTLLGCIIYLSYDFVSRRENK